jgi:hypothetical protein
MNRYLMQYPEVEGVEPFTPARLREIAAKWDEIAQSIYAGTNVIPNVDLSIAHHRGEQALGVARFMEREGMASARNIGCFQLDQVKKGDVVRIKKGILLSSMEPKFRQRGCKKVNGATRNIVVHRFEHGWGVDLHKEHKAYVSMPGVVWAGAGGYWLSARLDDIEIVSRAA